MLGPYYRLKIYNLLSTHVTTGDTVTFDALCTTTRSVNWQNFRQSVSKKFEVQLIIGILTFLINLEGLNFKKSQRWTVLATWKYY